MSGKLSELAERIEAARQARGMSRVGLARAAGLGDSAVSDIVGNPGRSPRLASVLAIAQALGVPLDTLVPVDGVGGAGGAGGSGAVPEAGAPDLRECAASGPAAGQEMPDARCFVAGTTAAAAFCIAPGDLVTVAGGTAAQNGELVVTEADAGAGPGVGPGGAARFAVRYFAEPMLFGFTAAGRPVHGFAAAPGTRIVGPVVGVTRRADR